MKRNHPMCPWRPGCGGTHKSGSEGSGEETTGREGRHRRLAADPARGWLRRALLLCHIEAGLSRGSDRAAAAVPSESGTVGDGDSRRRLFKSDGNTAASRARVEVSTPLSRPPSLSPCTSDLRIDAAAAATLSDPHGAVARLARPRAGVRPSRWRHVLDELEGVVPGAARSCSRRAPTVATRHRARRSAPSQRQGQGRRAVGRVLVVAQRGRWVASSACSRIGPWT
jgi:hypothetical protein